MIAGLPRVTLPEFRLTIDGLDLCCASEDAALKTSWFLPF